MAQLHKKFTDNQVKELMERYLKKEIERKYIQQILGIGKSRFFELIAEYRKDPKAFSIQYTREIKTRAISQSAEKNIVKELSIDKKLIEDENVPLNRYNYSYVKTRLETEYKQKVSLPTIIDRAKKHGFYLKKHKKVVHEREVITNYAGELIQHDSSHHLFSPAAKKKWYLITSIDDFSRFMLYATLLERETTWTHILALQTVFLKYGLPYSYYVDSHRIFRFVQGRDSIWRKHYLLTDDVDTQFREFAIKPPYESAKERMQRTIDAYRKISLKNLQIKVNNASPRETVNLRIYPMSNGVSEVRFWCNNKLIDVQRVKNDDLGIVHF